MWCSLFLRLTIKFQYKEVERVLTGTSEVTEPNKATAVMSDPQDTGTSLAIIQLFQQILLGVKKDLKLLSKLPTEQSVDVIKPLPQLCPHFQFCLHPGIESIAFFCC